MCPSQYVSMNLAITGLNIGLSKGLHKTRNQLSTWKKSLKRRFFLKKRNIFKTKDHIDLGQLNESMRYYSRTFKNHVRRFFLILWEVHVEYHCSSHVCSWKRITVYIKFYHRERPSCSMFINNSVVLNFLEIIWAAIVMWPEFQNFSSLKAVTGDTAGEGTGLLVASDCAAA